MPTVPAMQGWVDVGYIGCLSLATYTSNIRMFYHRYPITTAAQLEYQINACYSKITSLSYNRMLEVIHGTKRVNSGHICSPKDRGQNPFLQFTKITYFWRTVFMKSFMFHSLSVNITEEFYYILINS